MEVKRKPRPNRAKGKSPVEREDLFFLPTVRLAVFINDRAEELGSRRTAATINSALESLAAAKGKKQAMLPRSFFRLLNNPNRFVELDMVDYIYTAFGRADLFYADYPELYEW